MDILNKLPRKVTKHWDISILTLLITVYIALFSTLSILRHNAFASNFDLANMDQTIWNTIHGRIFVMSTADGNASRLGTHADFILIILAPLYFIWDNVRMLLISQSVMLGLGAIPVYLLSRKVLNYKLLSVILAAVYLFNPEIQWTNIYDFHGVALAVPFLLFTFYFAYTKKWPAYWIFFFLSLITKEEISLFLAIMGIFIILLTKSWKVGITSFLIGMIWFPLMIFIVIPHFSPNGQHWAFNEWYSTAKTDIDHDNFVDLFILIGSNLISVSSIDYYLNLLKPFAYLPLLGLPLLVMALPEIIINITSDNPGMQSIILHYDSGVVPALIISLIFGFQYFSLAIKRIKSFIKSHQLVSPIKTNYLPINLSVTLSSIVLIFSIVSDYYYGPLPISPSCWCSIYKVSTEDIAFENLLHQIPNNATISASNEVRPHLTHRQNAFNIPTITPQTQFVAMIDQNRVVGNITKHKKELSLIKKFSANSQKYQLISHLGHFYLFKILSAE